MRHRRLVVEAMTLCTAARCLRVLVPAPRWEAAIGRKEMIAGDPPLPSQLPTGLDREVSMATWSAARRLPFTPNCLEQALAASWMLRRRGSKPTVVIGLSRDRQGDSAHAWLIGEGGAVLTGGASAPKFVAVTAFR